MLRLLPAVVFAWLGAGAPSRADLPPDSVKAGKAATALVELPGTAGRRGIGSAFCIDRQGLFVTNAHVAGAARERLKIVLNAGDTDQKVVEATVLRADADADIAVLQADGGTDYPALELGDDRSLLETTPVTAFGFPFGGAMAIEKGEYPAVSVNVGRVTSLRRRKGELETIQFDAAVNPGNSGGPVLDDKGRAVGIVQAGVRGASVNFAIPIQRLRALLAKPEIVVTPTTIPYDLRAEERAFAVRVVTLSRPAPTFGVSLTLTAGTGEPRTFQATAGRNAVYTVKAPPSPIRQGPKLLQLNARFRAGTVTCRAPDSAVRVGERAVQLTDLRRIEGADGKVKAVLADGTELTGPLGGADGISADLGGATIKLDLTRATSVTIERVDDDVRAIAYKAVVKLGDAPVGEATGSIELVAPPTTRPDATPDGDWTPDLEL